MFRSKFRCNLILILGIFFIAQYFITFSIVENLDKLFQRRLFDYNFTDYLYLQLFFVSFIGPALEEISFRLFIDAKKRWMIMVSIALLCCYLLISFDILLAILLLVAIIVSLILSHKFKKFRFLEVQIVLSSLIFSMIHFDDDLIAKSQYLLYTLFLYFFGMGLILSWLKININIFASIGFHILINSIPIVLLIFSTHDDDHTLMCGQRKITYNSKLFFQSNSLSTAKFKNDTLVIKNSNLMYILDMYNSKNDLQDKYYQTYPLMYYDMKIPEFRKISTRKLLQCLQQENIIKKDLKEN